MGGSGPGVDDEEREKDMELHVSYPSGLDADSLQSSERPRPDDSAERDRRFFPCESSREPLSCPSSSVSSASRNGVLERRRFLSPVLSSRFRFLRGNGG
jgi:hypothetical protein